MTTTTNRQTTSMKTILLLLFSTSCLYADIGLISPKDAQSLINHPDATKRPVVLDTRGGYKDYFRGHLPSAHHLNFDTLRGTDQAVPVQYLPNSLTTTLLERAGANKNRTHLVYATGAHLPNDEILSASMVAYVLEKVGIEDIRIVDGGLAGWQKAGLPVTQDYFGNPSGTLPTKGHPEISANIDDVLSNTKNSSVVLVDARPINEFVGDDDVWLRKGHIPGAVNFHWARLMDAENTHLFKSYPEVKEQLETAGITKEKEIICYCGTSREGSLVRFYLKHIAGYPKVRLYEGAWKEYIWLKDRSLPAETGKK
jgi:thiosulfate/3-mercaptopyruvate sulfurtransferase